MEKSARHFFSEEEEQQLIAAIVEAESHTSGEVRLHLENHCKKKPPLERAWEIFHRLKMDQTAARNGILIYLAVKDHKFALLADQGINDRVPEGYWDELVGKMGARFREGEFLKGLTEGIVAIGLQLKHYFPRREDDENELSDDISYGE